MKKNPLLLIFAALIVAFPPSSSAQVAKVWTGGDGDFFNAANWDVGSIPGLDPMDIATINNGSTATIDAAADVRTLGGIRLGDVEGGTESGHIIMNGGRLVIGSTLGDPNQVIIGLSATNSTFIMNGGEIHLDAPETGALSPDFSGVNEIDWEVGLRGMGRFEMHGDSAFYASDDLKVAENAAGAGSVLIDGNARVAVGSGISISSGGTNEQTMVIGGNARVDAGNSMGAGNPLGGSDEGYLTMSINEGVAKLTIQENGVLNIRRLSSREGTSTIIVKDHGQFHIFDVLNGAGTNAATRPAETIPNSTHGSAATSDATLILQDDAQMTVNSAPESGPTRGLGISAPRDPGNPGGKAILRIEDRASLSIEQELMLGTGANAATSDGTLEVVGPNANISIGGNLNMAVDLDGNIAGLDELGTPTPGKSILSAVIAGAAHSPVKVDGIARIGQGRLKVTLDGFTPTAGTSYTLIQGGTIEGQFVETDFSEAVLPQGMGWNVEYGPNSVKLNVAVQPGLPGTPENNGLSPKTETIFVNTPDTVNNGNTESLGVAIADNGNVIVGWEDDHEDDLSLQYIAAAWTLYDSTGAPITPPTEQTSLAVGGSTTSRFLSYFRANGSAIPPFTSWGPKIKANLFGEGFGMGATSYGLGMEVAEFAAIQNNALGENAGDFPSVQLLTSTGSPVGIVSGVSEPYAEREGDIRIGDWDFLSNGNVLVVGESRQANDLVDVYGGASPATHTIYRIVDRNGNEIKAVSLASELAEGANMWHGSGVTSNGFAIRFEAAGQATIRLFNNDGTPASANIDLATLTGHPITAGGGRGDGVGFHGNGKDAYAAVNLGTDERGTNAVWVTVLNADGTVRYSKSASEDVAILGLGRGDVAIDETGRVLVVYDAQVEIDDGTGFLTPVRLVMGRLLDASGNFLGGTFHVSEKETPDLETLEARRPRAAWRNGTLAVAWESLNSGADQRVVALRLFSVGAGGDLQLAVEQASAGTIRLSWSGGNGPFLVQKKVSLSQAAWMDVMTTNDREALLPNDGTTGFFRVAGGATGQVTPLTAFLGAVFEKPSTNSSPATGVATLSLAGNTLSIDVAYSGLTGVASAAHIHGFSMTAEGSGVIIPLNGPFGTSGRITGTVTVTEEQRTNILNGRTYVNIHTPANGGGEIRGQVIPMNLRATLNGANERPDPIDTPATGTGKFTLVGNELFVDVSYTGLKGTASNAHIHGPAPATGAAGVLVGMVPLHEGPLATAGRFLGSVVLDVPTLSALIDGLTYFNIHSSAHGGGEIRGQIMP